VGNARAAASGRSPFVIGGHEAYRIAFGRLNAGFVEVKNLARRQTSKADQQRAAEALLRARPELSDRTIARQRGIAPPTIEILRDKLAEESNVGNVYYDST
jgi:hypothetical protein